MDNYNYEILFSVFARTVYDLGTIAYLKNDLFGQVIMTFTDDANERAVDTTFLPITGRKIEYILSQHNANETTLSALAYCRLGTNV